MKRKKYGREPGIVTHRWIAKVLYCGRRTKIIYRMTKKEILWDANFLLKKRGAKIVQIFKAIHEFEEAWEP